MALRLPGKGNFKPVRPIKPGVRRPPVAGKPGLSQPSQTPKSQPVSSQATEAISATQTSQPSEPSSLQLAEASQNEKIDKPAPTSAAAPAAQCVDEPPVPVVAAPPPAIDVPPLVIDVPPSVLDLPPTVAAAPLLELSAPSSPPPESSAATPAQRNATPTPKKRKPLLAAAAAAASGSASARHSRAQSIRSTPEPQRGASPAPRRFTPAVGPLGASFNAGPPVVGSAGAEDSQEAPAEQHTPPSPGTQVSTLAEVAVASIQPKSRKKRRGRQDVDVDGGPAPPAPPKRARRTPARPRRAPTTASDDGDGADEPTGEEGSQPRRKSQSQKSQRPGMMRKPSGTPKAPSYAHPELDGIEENGRVGEGEFDSSTLTLSQLATVPEGRVSARTIKLHQFQRSEQERKVRERTERAELKWRQLQIVRRRARELRNGRRAERRKAIDEAGGIPEEAVSDDSQDSEEEYEPIPDRLTPPGSPRGPERVAPIQIEPLPEAEANPEAIPVAAAEDEDIEGLGLAHHADGEDEEFGEALEDFQLPVDDGGDETVTGDFSGLQYGDYAGGMLDDEGNWVEGGANAAAILQQRNEENRRRILEGDDDRQVEVIDNETQFINYATWGKKVNNDRWSVEETELFFDVLRETGENYTLMKAYFPGRTVQQLKKKGRRENRANPQRMTDAIFNRKAIDKAYLAKSAGFNTDLPYDKEKAFFEEVAKEKERVLLGLDEEDPGEVWNAEEFGHLPPPQA